MKPMDGRQPPAQPLGSGSTGSPSGRQCFRPAGLQACRQLPAAPSITAAPLRFGLRLSRGSCSPWPNLTTALQHCVELRHLQGNQHLPTNQYESGLLIEIQISKHV
ncbi:hypothetical protein NDU88_005872 [Pleurodeles waltl]|uniref:Uncharacterized protein n=1 Tax=Pleurodeles waltl TaxID=8319 RepID=A0AAV7WAT1_PLEWA|nr:hypothetical protein NDU88_005872 [Pleurodeles waltl]